MDNVEQKKSYIEAFHEVVDAYGKYPSQETLFEVLSILFEGIDKGHSLACPAEFDEKGEVRFRHCMRTDGTGSMVILSKPDGEKYPLIADVPLRMIFRIILDEEYCDGILINPGEDSTLFIPKAFLASAIGAGFQIALDCSSAE